jgi:hypothetical protein
MMLKVAKLGIALAAVLAWIAPAAYAGIPDVTNSWFVPQSGSVGTPQEGTIATRFFRQCPNNDISSGTILNNSARIKVHVADVNNNPIPNVAAADICVLFNGGTAAQGFSGVGADSVIANTQWNATCPDIRCMAADAPTNSSGDTYITFAGADVATPGVALRSLNRKWGHYDTTLPVYVLGFQLSGRLTSGAANGTYTLRIKNCDTQLGLLAIAGQGEIVGLQDYTAIANFLFVNSTTSYWKDLDSSGAVNAPDFTIVSGHSGHACAIPTP